ncbi:unnamed protein product [Amoebophrya sp. A25]|nr:unnamed protein product [Amoebophrya sp. A25]|eukprot:GSA25T00022788001.1
MVTTAGSKDGDYFSLNTAIVQKLPVGEHALDSSKEYPLRYTWILSEMTDTQNKNKTGWDKDGIHEVAKIDSISSFWKYWNFLPQPSELLLGKRLISQRDGTSAVNCVMLFRQNIKPAWEDPFNAEGGEFRVSMKKASFQEVAGLADELWNNLVLGVLGGTIQPASMISGLRLVDRLDYSKAHSALRIEVWFTDRSRADPNEVGDKDFLAVVAQLKKSVETCMLTKLNGEKRTEKAVYGEIATSYHGQPGGH